MKLIVISVLILHALLGFSQLKEKTSKPNIIKTKDYAGIVNPFIGTGGHGHTYPGSSFPFGMMQLSPDSRKEGWDGCGGYHDSDSALYGFSHTHLSGTGVPDYADLLFLPYTGESVEEKVPFDKSKTCAYAGYFETFLSQDKIKVELSTSTRAGYHRYTFDKEDKEERKLKVDLAYRDLLRDSDFEQINDFEIRGKRVSKAWAEEQHLYFYIKTKQKIRFLNKENNVYYLNFGKDIDELDVKVGISAVDEMGAKNNLDEEINHWEFSIVKRKNRKAWNKELSKIEVKNFDSEYDTIFYTALYHSYLNPNTFSDVDGRYRGMDYKIHKSSDHTQYTVFSLWDTFRATHPLFTLTQREKTEDFIATFLKQYQEGGELPIWELSANYTGCMIGYHAVPVIVDAYNKGIRNFDKQLALEAMVSIANADELGKHIYAENGVLEQGDEPESVSKQLEYAYDDWCIAIFADSLGEKEIAKTFYQRALSYRNIYNPSTGFMQPRINGAFASNFKPKEVTFSFTEANSYQYSLFAPQDIAGLIKTLGGKDELEAWLDRLFKADSNLEGRHQSDITGLIGQYAHGNEPSHHMAYLYNYTNHPEKSNFYINKILTEQYWNAPDGLSGNEDCGQMSSWYVLSALGMYSVTPGSAYFDLSSPIVTSAKINLENGKTFEIEAKNRNAENIYVQSITLNGRKYKKLYLEISNILNGGKLEFVFGSTPQLSLYEYAAPFSEIADDNFVTIPTFSTDIRSFKEPFEVQISNPTHDSIVIHFNNCGTNQIMNLPKSDTLISIRIEKSTSISAYAVRNGVRSKTVKASYTELNSESTIEILAGEYTNQYNGGGQNALIDGISGRNNYKTGEFQGFNKDDVKVLIDLKKKQKINNVNIGILRDINSWIFFPREIVVNTYKKKGRKILESKVLFIDDNNESDYHNPKKRIENFKFSKKGRYVEVTVKNYGVCPGWHLGAGGDTWIFMDEIEVK